MVELSDPLPSICKNIVWFSQEVSVLNKMYLLYVPICKKYDHIAIAKILLAHTSIKNNLFSAICICVCSFSLAWVSIWVYFCTGPRH